MHVHALTRLFPYLSFTSQVLTVLPRPNALGCINAVCPVCGRGGGGGAADAIGNDEKGAGGAAGQVLDPLKMLRHCEALAAEFTRRLEEVQPLQAQQAGQAAGQAAGQPSGQPTSLGLGLVEERPPEVEAGARAGVGTVGVIGAEAEAAEKPIGL